MNVLLLDSMTELNTGRNFEIVLAELGEEVEEDWSWLGQCKGPEVVVDPDQMGVLIQESEQDLWDEVEARLDDWPSKKADDVGWLKDLNRKDFERLRMEYLLDYAELRNMFRENLRYADKTSIDTIIDKMELYDFGAQNCGLWKDNPPSLIGSLQKEILEAQDRPIVFRKPSSLIAMGKFERVVVDGVVHIVLKKEVNVV